MERRSFLIAGGATGLVASVPSAAAANSHLAVENQHIAELGDSVQAIGMTGTVGVAGDGKGAGIAAIRQGTRSIRLARFEQVDALRGNGETIAEFSIGEGRAALGAPHDGACLLVHTNRTLHSQTTYSLEAPPELVAFLRSEMEDIGDMPSQGVQVHSVFRITTGAVLVDTASGKTKRISWSDALPAEHVEVVSVHRQPSGWIVLAATSEEYGVEAVLPTAIFGLRISKAGRLQGPPTRIARLNPHRVVDLFAIENGDGYVTLEVEEDGDDPGIVRYEVDLNNASSRRTGHQSAQKLDRSRVQTSDLAGVVVKSDTDGAQTVIASR